MAIDSIKLQKKKSKTKRKARTGLVEARDVGALRLDDDGEALGVGRHQRREVRHVLTYVRAHGGMREGRLIDIWMNVQMIAR